MNKTRSSFATLRTKTQINLASQGSLPCPSHPSFNISHVCLCTTCTQSISFCSECLFETQHQQHLAKHKEHIIGWNDLMILCRRQSVSGRLGDEPQKELNQIVLSTQAHQASFKTYIKNQEQLINNDFDGLVTKFTEMINKVKAEFMAPYKNYLQDLMDMGTILEKLVSDYYLEKNKDYNNDYDNFLSEVSKLQDQQTSNKKSDQNQFNLRKLMQNIIPLVSKANGQFQRALQQQNLNVEEGESQKSGYSLFSNMALKQSDNQVLNDLVNDYKVLLNSRPCYKNQGLAQQTYNGMQELIEKCYHSLTQVDFMSPGYKSQMIKMNKENISLKQQLASPKGTKYLETIIKEQSTKTLKQLTKLEEDEDEIKEMQLKHRLRQTTQLIISDPITSISFVKTIKTTHKQGINCMVQFDDDFIATGSNDRTVKIYRYRVYELFKEIQFKSDVTSLAVQIRKDGSSFLIVGLFKDICILNQGFEVLKSIDRIHNGQINSIVCLEDATTIFSCAQGDNRLLQWNTQNDQQKKYFEHRDSITCMTLLGDQYIASGGKDRNIKVYRQTLTNNVFEKLQLSMSLSDAHPTEVTSLAYGGGNILYSSSASGELKVWDFMDGTLIKQVKNYAGWCFRIINFQIEEEQTPQQKTQLQTTIQLCGSPRRKKQPQNEYECIKNSFIGTVSFDGTFKVFNGKTLLNDNPQPMITTQLKSLHDCHPFGGVLAIRDSITDKIDILSSGNKNDCNIQLYSLAQS
ncbi:unnamed protein product [Paramecium primaurelia]|uniref:Uncharacterized protein n=1 Tax=Paramecium primaurelia TaxID=5886 RepID=A0A8S1KNJ0_PARPR|nr:unnamed protein product [Paramecium primaurelia]